ncbi:MAG: MerR family transcriptional regulator [Turicibacter sp.]
MNEVEHILIGQFAKKANVSIRTLQYYDKIGLLKPSLIDERGRRVYQKSDLVLLHQIMTLKTLGLTLDEIKSHVMPVQNSNDVLLILNHQQNILKEQISKAQKVLQSIDLIKEEIDCSQVVDWSKYANMMALIQENNDYYWMSHYLDSDMMEKISKVHQADESQHLAADWLKHCLEKAIELDEAKVSPTSEKAQELANVWWSYVNQYTNGNQELMQKLFDFYSGDAVWPDEFGEIQRRSQSFMQKAIEYYLNQKGLL